MKKLSWVVFAGLTSIAAFKVTAQDIIRIATGEYPPYYSEKLPDYGLNLYVVTQVFARMGIQVEYGFFPWSRSLQLAKNNAWDLSCCWTVTPERSKHFYFSDAIRKTSEYVFYHLKSYPFDWHSVDDLANIEIGTTIRFSYGHEFDSAERSGHLLIEKAPSDEINFRKLLGGRIKLFPIGRDKGQQILSELFSPEQSQLLTYHPKPISAFTTGLMISKNNKNALQILEAFNKELAKFKASDTYRQYGQDRLNNKAGNKR